MILRYGSTSYTKCNTVVMILIAELHTTLQDVAPHMQATVGMLYLLLYLSYIPHRGKSAVHTIRKVDGLNRALAIEYL